MPPNSHGVVTKQPRSLLWKPLKIDGWGLFQSVAKTAQALRGADLLAARAEALKAVQCIKFKEKTDGELAWALVYTAMTSAVADLLNDVRGQFTIDTHERLAAKAAEIDRELDAAGIPLNEDFFTHPSWCDYAIAVSKQFRNWLIAVKIDDASADRVSRRLPRLFATALHEEWHKNKDVFAKLLPESRRTPFATEIDAEAGWAEYAAWLDEEANRRVFDEDFGLMAVYVPLRAYVEDRAQDRSPKRTVGLAEEMLDTWLERGRSNDAIRIIEGDPGAGKSSLARRYAATRFGRNFSGRFYRVVFAPLHDIAFAAGKSIEDATADFTQRVTNTNLIPIDRIDHVHTLLILDGLDELSRGGQFGLDIIRAFMSQVTALLKIWNHRDTAQLLVLISGRPVATGEIKAEVRTDGAVINLLPFLVNNLTMPEWYQKAGSFADPQGLLLVDQRADWYERYAIARNLTNGGELYTKIQSRYDLQTVTSQPLLNYLVAFLTRENAAGELPANLCGLYEALLHKIWTRGWERGQVPAIDKLDYEPFCQLLETIAIAAWHSGNARSVRVNDVENRLTEKQKTQLATLEKGVKAGVLRLLFAFFLRPGVVDRGDQIYEFTHKTFLEYLVSRLIVREIDILATDWKRSAGGRNWKDEIRLQDWADIFGPNMIDRDLYLLLTSALASVSDNSEGYPSLHERAPDIDRQAAIAQLLNAAVRDGMPMHTMIAKLKPCATFQEMNRQAINCEIALLHILCICFSITNERVRIPALESNLQAWMGGRWRNYMTHEYVYMSIDMSRINLADKDLNSVDLRGVSLREADLRKANLRGADLSVADLSGADLSGADLRGAELSGAHFIRANLTRTNLARANLHSATLDQANLSGADLSGADLSGAHLTEVVGVTYDSLKVVYGDPAEMPDGKPPKKQWRASTPRTSKRSVIKPPDPSPPTEV